MTSSDRPPDADVEKALATLLVDCHEALVRGEDPAPLLEQLRPLSAETRQQFTQTLECLRIVQEVLPVQTSPAKHPRQFGKFRLLRVLGRGGFGLVWLAEDPELRRSVALTVPRVHLFGGPESAERFLREARAAASLEHPNLVPVFEIGQVDGLTYLASAYCEGPSLAEWLRAETAPVPVRAAAELVEVLARAAAYMHGRGIWHRDLKPSNVLLFFRNTMQKPGDALRSMGGPLEDHVPRITDFGLARCQEAVGDLTRTGVVLGTPAYMAPEQAWGRPDHVGAAADIYSLGAILYEMLTGQPPFRAGSDLETLRQARDEELIPPRRLRSDTPCDLETICLKCLEKAPGKRYGGMTQLADDLRRFREGRPIAARPNGPIGQLLKWVRRQPRVAGLVGMAGVFLIALTAVSTWVGFREHSNKLALASALQTAEDQRKLAVDRERSALNQAYAAQIRSSWELQKGDQIASMRKLLCALKPKADEVDLRGFEWQYLWRFEKRDFLHRNHGVPVRAIAYSSDGEMCASGDAYGGIKLFDVNDGKLHGPLYGHGSLVWSIDFLANDTQLISAGFAWDHAAGDWRGELIQWSLGAKNEILWRAIYRHKEKHLGHPMFAVAARAGMAFIIDRGKTHRLLMRDLNTAKERVLLDRDTKDLAFVVTTPNAETIAVGYRGNEARDTTIEILDPFSGKSRGRREFKGNARAASISADGKTLAIAVSRKCNRDEVEICDVPSLATRFTSLHDHVTDHYSFDAQGSRLAFFTVEPNNGYRLNLLDVRTGRHLDVLQPDFACTSLTFSPNGRELAFGGRTGQVRIRKVVASPEDHVIAGPLPKSEAWCVAFSRDGNTLVAGYDNENGADSETLKFWDLTTRKGKTLAGHRSTVMALAVSADGKVLATAGYDETVRLWDMASGECRKMLQGHTAPVRALAFSPDGSQLVSGGSDQSIKLWNLADRSLLKSWQGHSNVRALAFSTDGKYLISAGNDYLIKVWNAADHALVHTIQEESKVQGLACSPSGTLVASANEKNGVNLWDVASGSLVQSLPGHTGKVRTVAFSPDGKTLASGGADKTVRLWHVATGQEMLALPVEHFVNGLAFDRQGKTLAAALHDGTVKIWPTE